MILPVFSVLYCFRNHAAKAQAATDPEITQWQALAPTKLSLQPWPSMG
jgi:hypothetical protein